AEILGGKLGDEGCTDFGREEVIEGRSEAFVDDFGVLEVGSHEEVELVDEVANIDAAEWVHLGEREDAGKDYVGDGAVGGVPANVDDFLVFFGVLDRHGHVIICRDDLEEVIAEAAFKQFSVPVEQNEEKAIGSDGGEVPAV